MICREKSIMELADGIWVNKADGVNRQKTLSVQADYGQILHYIRPSIEGWQTKAYTCSALTGERIDLICRVVDEFRKIVSDSVFLRERWKQQTLTWGRNMTTEYLRYRIDRNAGVAEWTARIEREVAHETLVPTLAARRIKERMEKLLFK